MVITIKNKIVGVILAGTIAAGAIAGYVSLNSYLDRNLKKIVEERWFAPDWVKYFPGGKKKILEVYLEDMKRYYKTAPYQSNTVAFDRAISFARHNLPEKEPEVYEEIIRFLEQENDMKEAEFYRREYETIMDFKKRKGR